MNALSGLDIEDHTALVAHLRRASRVGPGERARPRTLRGGVSNRTVLVELGDGRAWVLKQALAQLRVDVDWFSRPERIGREALGLRTLAELAPAGAITPLVFEEPEHHLLAMEAVPEPHENWKAVLLTGRVERAHVEAFGALLGTIHARAAARAAELRPVFADREFFESLRLEPYYEYTATRVPAASEFLHALAEQTRSLAVTLVHGDYSPKNVLVREGRLVLLDHEVIHWGDPAFDGGFALALLVSKAHHLPEHRAAFADAAVAFWGAYERRVAGAPFAGAPLEARTGQHTLACLLARVAGRSPLEYLDPAERARQRDAVVALIDDPPARVADLVDAFLDRLR